ncbi:MAG: hypothetical protein JWP27_2845 [Flaviaesturariibacter sp.]|nr:hypothetical protein [Flaviaesturariibacter sp.]
MTRLLCACLALLPGLWACQKEIAAPGPEKIQAADTGYVRYEIKAGDHYCDKNDFRIIETTDMRFRVRFDSSAIYQTTDPANQDDINKLYGFSDNNAAHHAFSARFGWRWSAGALRLFGYVYNNSIVESKELQAVPIGADIECSLRVTPARYIFTVNGAVDSLPRRSVTQTAKGYQLYPYFGGDEAAPHTVRILIQDLK